MNKKQVILNFYKIINWLPFNNKFKGKINVFNKGAILRKCKVVSLGTNNQLIFARGGYYKHCEFIIKGNNNKIIFGENCLANKAQLWIEDSNNYIEIGNRTVFSGKIQLAAIEGTTIRIGDDCLFSSEIMLRTGDSHSILSLEGKRVNLSQDIVIEDHVWVGHRASINKGALFSQNSIVGACAVVTKKFYDGNVIIAGVPAYIIKQGINWKSERVLYNNLDD